MSYLSTEGIKNPASGGNLTLDVTNGGNVRVDLGDTLGSNEFQVRDSASAAIMTVDSDGNVVVNGNLDVKGTTTTFETATQLIEDNMLHLNYVASGSGPTAQSGGFFIQREDLANESAPTAGTPSATHRQFIWNETDDVWAMQVDSTTITPLIYSSGTPSTAYGGTNPNLATRGAAAGNSGSAQVGVFDDPSFVYVNNPGHIQEAIRQLDSAIDGLGITGFTTPNLTLGTSNIEGSATTAIRSDATILTFDAVSPADVSTAGATGSASVAARRDHVHGHGSLAGGASLASAYHEARDVTAAAFTPSNYTPSAASDGNANFVSVEDHLRAIDTAFASTGGNAYGTVGGNSGIANAASISDTINIVGASGLSTVGANGSPDTLTISPTYATPAFTLGVTNVEGSADSFIRSDATLAIFDSTVPTTIQPDDTASTGSATVAARRDHTHAIEADTPVAIGTALSEGISTSFARADHVHTLDITDGDISKGGTASIGSGATTVAVTFTTAFGTACNRVVAMIENTVDATPLTIIPTITARSTTGFTATLSGGTDSANYSLHWVAYGS